MKRFILAAALAFLPGAAFAACGTATVTMLQSDGVTTASMDNDTGSAGHCANEVSLVAGGALTGTTGSPLQVSLANTAANATALLVTGTGGTFPISGTAAVTQSTNPWIVSGSGAAGTAATGVVTVQGIASMTKLLVTPDANSAVNVAQINGVTPLMGNGVTGTGSPRVTIASDNTAVAAAGQVATGAAPPTGATYIGTLQSGATGGHVAAPIMCDSHVFKHITSATDTLAVQGVASQTIYVCSWRSRAAGVATWFLENTASANANCSSSNTQINGVATEAANTGETWGAAFWSGLKNTSGNGLCINSTGTGGVDVDVWYTQF